jgi:hypothetical protein
MGTCRATFVFRAQADHLTSVALRGPQGPRFLFTWSGNLVQATSVGWKDQQKQFAFAGPFNDLPSPNLPDAMLIELFLTSLE